MGKLAPQTRSSAAFMVVPGFSERLELAIGSESINAFAKKAGIGESLIRNYIKKGTTPGLDKVIAIAKAADVSLDWLVLGKGTMRPAPKTGEQRVYIEASAIPQSKTFEDQRPYSLPEQTPPKLPEQKLPSSVPTVHDTRSAILRQLTRLTSKENPTIEETQQILHLSEALRALQIQSD